MKRKGLLLGLLLLLYLPGLGSPSSATHPDEAYYLGIGAEMQAQGAWLTPTIEGEPRWYKPPLFYWAQRVIAAAVGPGFWAGRLPAALSALALALVTGALAARAFGPRAGPRAALLVATCFGWLRFGRIAMLDASLALALATAAWGAWRAAEEDRPAALLWVGLGGGAALMLKGPVGPLIVLLAAVGFVAARRPALLATRWCAGAVALGAAVGLPWYVASLLRHGRRFWDFFVVTQNLDRFRHPWRLSGELVLLVGLVLSLLPWAPLCAAGLGRAARRWREPPHLLALLWTGAVLAAFSVPALKWPHYGLACTPALALLASAEEPPRWARALTAAVLACGALAAAAALRWPWPAAAVGWLLAAALALALAAALVARGRIEAGAVAAGLGLCAAVGLAVPAANPPVIPPAALARLDGRDLYVLDTVSGLFTLAAVRPVHRVDGAGALRALDRGGVVVVPGAADRLPPGTREGLVELAGWERARPYLGPADVLRSWWARDRAALFEPVRAFARPGAGGGAGRAPSDPGPVPAAGL